MNRPRLTRPTVRGLNTAKASVELADGTSVDLDDPAFIALVTRQEPFAVEYPLGTFLVISERRRRRMYWIARGYHAGRRASAYVGRKVDQASLAEAADMLRGRLAVETYELPSGNKIDDLIEKTLAAMSPAERAVSAAVFERLRKVAAKDKQA